MTRSSGVSPSSSPPTDTEQAIHAFRRGENGLTTSRDEALANAAQNIWADSEHIQNARERYNQSLGRMANASASGNQLLVDTLTAHQANERVRRQLTESQVDNQRSVLSHSLKAIGEQLQSSLGDSWVSLNSGVAPELILKRHHDGNQMISRSVTTALTAIGDTYNQQYDFLDAARASRSADAGLVLDMIERTVRIEKLLLESASDEFQKECAFKFKTIQIAIEFVQKVQVEMNNNSERLEREKDSACHRALSLLQEQAAKDRAMKELNMSQEAATRASDLLAQREEQAHRVKMEELSIQRSSERMDHERRTKRYFSIWSFLFR